MAGVVTTSAAAPGDEATTSPLATMPRGLRLFLAGLGVVVALNAAGYAADRVGGAPPSGPASSSFATAPDGLAAYADLLQRSGRDVERLREPLASARLDPDWTLVVLDPGTLADADVARLARFVEAGGRLVAGGSSSNGWLRIFAGPDLSKTARGPTVGVPLAPVPEIAGVQGVESAGAAAFSGTGRALPALGTPGHTLLAVAVLGAGRAALLADASPLQNQLLDAADNAALGLALAGPAGRRMVFVESVHGFGAGEGVAAIPASWRWFTVLAVAAAGAWMLARGRRLGPPQLPERDLPPPRRAFVEAVAATLARTSDLERRG